MENEKKRRMKKKRKIRRYKRIRALIITICFFIGIYFFLTKTPIFAIKNFSINGNNQLKKVDIVNTSGIYKGENIFKIDKEKASNKLKNMAYIEDVIIKRSLPNTIKIDIKEKKEVFTVKFHNKIYYVGKDAEPLMIVSEKERKEKKIPILEGLKVKEPQILKILDYSNKGIENKELVGLAKGLEKDNLFRIIKKIEITDDSQIIMTTYKYQTIKLGKFRDIEYKMKLLNNILKDLKNKKIDFYIIDYTKSKRVIVQKMTDKNREEIDEKIQEEKKEKDLLENQEILDNKEDSNEKEGEKNNEIQENNQDSTPNKSYKEHKEEEENKGEQKEENPNEILNTNSKQLEKNDKKL